MEFSRCLSFFVDGSRGFLKDNLEVGLAGEDAYSDLNLFSFIVFQEVSPNGFEPCFCGTVKQGCGEQHHLCWGVDASWEHAEVTLHASEEMDDVASLSSGWLWHRGFDDIS